MYISKLDEFKRVSEFGFFGRIWFKRKVFINNRRYLVSKGKEYSWLFDDIDGKCLDDVQREIVLSDEDDMLVVAGAGSGKSLTIVAKILYLVNCGVDPRDILCISFTNMACNSLKKSLRRCNVDMEVYTFHKLGFKFLRDNGYRFSMVEDDVLPSIVDDVLRKHDLLDILPDYDFVDVGDGDFRFLHNLLSFETKEVYNLKVLLTTFINLFKGNGCVVSDFDLFFKCNLKEDDMFKRRRNERLLGFAKDIFCRYDYFLCRNNCVDFNDLINKATLVLNGGCVRKYKYIIVDEYQDSSVVKCKFIQAIKKKTGAKVMAVGDDFQSIYQFTGSNLDVFFNFESFFPCAKVFMLKKTYRNCMGILNVMGRFILKNPKQIRKRLVSSRFVDNPIRVVYYDGDVNYVLNKVLELVGDDVLILGRNNRDLCGIKVSKGRVMTVHKSKGLEADNVILINLYDGVLGFPNKVIDDGFLKFVKSDLDGFSFAEERRLFYVAMTRTRNVNYLLVDRNRPSLFVSELMDENDIFVLDVG